MLAPNQLLDAAEELLKERFPGETVYRNAAPGEFDRPSFLVRFGPVSMADACCGCVEVSAALNITAFVSADGSGGPMEELPGRMFAVQELFAAEGLRVEGRVLHMAGTKGECQIDHAEITATLQYRDDRPGGREWPLMGEIEVRRVGAQGS